MRKMIIPDVQNPWELVSHLPKWNDIPVMFKDPATPEVQLYDLAFRSGVSFDQFRLTPRDGVEIDIERARKILRFLFVIPSTRDYKQAVWAWMFHEWFEIPKEKAE